MPSWKKVIVSGSDASLNNINVSTLCATGNLQGSVICASLCFVGNFCGTVACATTAGNSNCLGGTPAACFVTTCGDQSIGGVKTFTSDISLVKGTGVPFTISTTGTGNNLILQTNSGGIILSASNNSDISFKDGTDTNMVIKGDTGNVGIGTTTPSTKVNILGTIGSDVVTPQQDLLHIGGNELGGVGGYAGIRFGGTQGTAYSTYIRSVKTLGFGNYWDSALTFSVTRTNTETTIDEAMRITSAGNVGIGTTSPGVPLQISGNGTANTFRGVLRILNTDSQQWAGLSLPDGVANDVASNNYYFIGRGNSLADRTLSFHIPTTSDYGSGNQPKFLFASTGADELFSVQASTGNAYHKGNVGIGTTTPTAKLHITDSNKVFDTFGNLNVFTSDASTVNAGGAIALGGNNSTGGTSPYVFAKIQGIKEGATDTWNGALLFGTTQTNSAVVERMRINSSGNVGIGTTAPILKLDVNGAIRAVNTNTSAGSFITLGEALDGSTPFYIERYGSTNANALGVDIWNASNGFIRIGTNNAERMRIDASGNVGIGTCTPGCTLSVVGSICSSGQLRAGTIASVGNIDIGGEIIPTNSCLLVRTAGTIRACIDSVGICTPGTLRASTVCATSCFVGNFCGNATTATSATSATSAATWTTGRTLTIGNTGKFVNGSESVAWSLNEIGAAPVFRNTISVSNTVFTNIATITGNSLASAVTITLQGTSGNTVVNVKADILVNHFQDTQVTTTSGNYSQLEFRIISNDNETFSIEARVINSPQSTDLNIEIFPLNNESVTFGGTLQTGTTLTFNTEPGVLVIGTDGTTTTGRLQSGNLRLNVNTISSENTNGHIILSPNGAGNVGIGTTTPGCTLSVVGSICSSDHIRASTICATSCFVGNFCGNATTATSATTATTAGNSNCLGTAPQACYVMTCGDQTVLGVKSFEADIKLGTASGGRNSIIMFAQDGGSNAVCINLIAQDGGAGGTNTVTVPQATGTLALLTSTVQNANCLNGAPQACYIMTCGNHTLDGLKVFNTPSGITYNACSGDIGLTVFNNSGGDAMMTFHVSGDYAGYFGLGGAENDLVWTGWSVGNTRHRILHSGNFNSYTAGNSNCLGSAPQSCYVMTCGNQTIDGVKTFSSDVIISKASPTLCLNASAAGSATLVLGPNSTGGTGGIINVNSATLPLILQTNSCEGIRLTSAGNVGIGATSPGQKLQVDGSLLVNPGTNTATAFRDIMMGGIGGWTPGESHGIDTVYSTASSPTTFSRIESHFDGTDGKIRFRNLFNASAPRTDILMTIQGNGNVGIGTDTPGTKLEVNGAIRGGCFPIAATNTGEAWFGRASDRTLGTYTLQLGGASASNTHFEIVDRAWTKVIALISGEAPGSSFIVNSAGNVGIGTTSPEGMLTIGTTNPTINLGDTGVSVTDALIGRAASDNFHVTGTTTGDLAIRPEATKRIIFGTTSSAATVGVARMTIEAGGNVGIGTTTPGCTLSVVGSICSSGQVRAGTIASVGNIDIGGEISPTNSCLIVRTAGTIRACIDSVGICTPGTLRAANVCATTSICGPLLTISGTATVGSLVETSTRRLKENIKPFTSTTDQLLQLQPVSFTWKYNNKPDIGLIAEEVDLVVPEIVHKDVDGCVTGINYGKLSTIFINVIKEQQSRIEALESKLNCLLN